MRVSIALCTYNGSRYIKEQLDSIASQTLAPLEIVVSDDGSTDNTLEIVEHFAASHDIPIKIHKNLEPLGYADNFLSCASYCSGEIIAFCDQDDVWLPEKLRMSCERLVLDGSLLAIHTLTLVDRHLNEGGGIWTQDIRSNEIIYPLTLFPYKNGWGNSMTFRSDLLDGINHLQRPSRPEHEDTSLPHDTWIYILATAFGRVSHINTPLILYRQHGKNLSQTRRKGFTDKLRLKLRLSQVPLLQRQIFYQQLANFFSDLSSAGESKWAAQAGDAAAAYRAKEFMLHARARIYFSPTLEARNRAFMELAKSSEPRLAGRLKDFVIGVSGLHYVLVRKAKLLIYSAF